MKLCQLLHESGGCPTCGGPIDAGGQSAAKPSPSQLSFPDSEGIWQTDDGPKTADELDGKRPPGWKTQAVSPLEASPNRTQSFKKTLPIPRRR